MKHLLQSIFLNAQIHLSLGMAMCFRCGVLALYGVAIFVSLLFSLVPVYAQTTTTTQAVTITIPAISPIVVNYTTFRVNILNSSYVMYTWVCTYAIDPNVECMSINATTYDNSTNTLIDTWVVDVSNSSTYESLANIQLLRAFRTVYIGNASVLSINVTFFSGNSPTTYILYARVYGLQPPFVSILGSSVNLGLLIAAAIIVSLIMRGSLKLSAAGMVAVGALSIFFYLMGIQIPMWVSILLILVGLVLLYIER